MQSLLLFSSAKSCAKFQFRRSEREISHWNELQFKSFSVFWYVRWDLSPKVEKKREWNYAKRFFF